MTPRTVRVTDEELNRRADSVLRIVRETPGLSAGLIGKMLGDVSAREVRERIRRLRDRGEAITIGTDGQGYYHLDAIADERQRAEHVKAHRERTRSYLIDSSRLMRQIGKMTAVEVAQFALFDMLVPEVDGDDSRPGTMADLARLPVQRRQGVTRLLVAMLEGIEHDPEAFAYERALLADKFRGIFLTKVEAAKLAQARKLLEEVGV